jgi:hypothetical protein
MPSSGILRRVALVSVLGLLVTANVPSSSILVTLMMEAIRYTETSVVTRDTRRHIPEDGMLDKPFLHINPRVEWGCVTLGDEMEER